ncbi:hypothetical protein HDF24_23865 [Mucilaginibacter sp. X4EP1]|jgi:hypothetical protein|uniref:hypothetical protein n=1 Tax=Mucilaginibacter sp. X4EP1 TaxID=2723092 RepID=UPI00216A9113|nr:hypothetical protein [Mucilaginibacter sp. X4EP1]MCS3816128.1 hypothetical protein [Mucilaginibacter sp. X4EP1]
MNLTHIINLLANQLSAGNFSQNIGFYTLLVLLAWIWVVQLKHKASGYRIN